VRFEESVTGSGVKDKDEQKRMSDQADRIISSPVIRLREEEKTYEQAKLYKEQGRNNERSFAESPLKSALSDHRSVYSRGLSGFPSAVSSQSPSA
jgi:hypothetical protein